MACGYTIFVSKKEYFLNDSYPDSRTILDCVKWSARSGFDGIELGSRSFRHFVKTYSDDFAKEVRRATAEESFEVSQLTCSFLVRSTIERSTKEAKEMLDLIFDKAAKMSCRVLSASSTEVPGALVVPNSVYPEAQGARISLPGHFSWAEAWSRYTDAIGLIVEAAERYGLKFALEARPREMISTTDGLLNLLQAVGSDSFGALVDTAHLFVEQEYIPLSLHKLGKKVFAAHLTDSDGVIEHHWVPGEGKINWPEVLGAFEQIGYKNLLTIELFPLLTDSDEEFLNGKSFLESLSSKVRSSLK